MSLVVGTAGHIDHGKTSLLRALTGIDADRLPEERARGMTIDLGYAHLTLPDGRVLDFVDVPGHDRLVGNMLVGAGEVDAALLVVAADDGPRAQTLEHLALLDALGVHRGVVAVTKEDAVSADRVAAVVDATRRLVDRSRLRDSPLVTVSSLSGRGLDELRARLWELATRAPANPADAGVRFAVDRLFAVRGRGVVVTGTLRGGPVRAGASLWSVPGDGTALRVRVRAVQVRGSAVEAAEQGRTALNLAGVDPSTLRRGMVLTDDPAVAGTDRLLVRLDPPAALIDGERRGPWPPRDGARARLHVGTDAADATIGRAGRDALLLEDGGALAMLRVARTVAVSAGDRFVLRRPSPGGLLAGGQVLDALPALGIARRRQTGERVAALAAAVADGHRAAMAQAHLDLHGAVITGSGPPTLAPDVRAAALATATSAVGAWHATRPADGGLAVTTVRSEVARVVRRMTGLAEPAARSGADAVIVGAVADGALVRDGDLVRRPGHRVRAPDSVLLAAMDRLEAALATNAPPPLAATAAAVGCPPAGIRSLERSGRIVIVGPDLAWAVTTYRELAARALVIARRAPLTPAAYRDATGTSRRFALAILEDLDRRGILRRTEAGHVPGPKAPMPPAPARDPA